MGLDPIVAELLVTAALTIFWIPVAAAVNARKSKDIVPGTSYTLLNVEGVGNFILWVMWLVGAAIATVSGFDLYLISHICICLLIRCPFSLCSTSGRLRYWLAQGEQDTS